MRHKMWSHIKGNGVAYLALFVALGSTSAYATGMVGAGDIQRDAVQQRHIASNAVGSKQVAKNSLKGRDIAESSLQVTSAVGFAHVEANAGLDQPRSEGVAGVAQIPNDPGSYCFDLAPGVVSQNVIATRHEEPNQNAPLEVVVELGSTDPFGLSDCPAGFRDAFVGFRNGQSGVNAAFFVLFH